MIICCGQATRGDDAAGLEAGLLLRSRGLDVVILERDGFALLDAWEGQDDVVLIDAVSSGLAPGTVTVLEMDGRERLEQVRVVSTHSAGIAEAIALAAALGRLPHRLVLYGIEVSSTAPFTGISDAVRTAIARVAEELASRSPAKA